MQLVDGFIPVFGTADENTLRQIRTCAKTAERVALLPDNHLGYSCPIGGVLAYKNAISPTGVGYDIGCGIRAIRVDMDGEALRKDIKSIMDEVWKHLSFGIGRKNAEKVEHSLFEDDAWNLNSLRPLKDKAYAQLGTIGGGNHWVNIFTDERDRVWIGTHFGSRGFGHGVATQTFKAAGSSEDIYADPVVLSTSSELGIDYLEGMRLAGEYAYAGRQWVCDRVARILGVDTLEAIENHHNFSWEETHEGETYWVVRKGATPAFPGQRGVVGSSMCEPSVILEGVENEEAKYSLYSTVHGAGRAIGRSMAKGTFDKKTGAVKRPGLVSREMMNDWVKKAGIELRGAGIDESPDCYKRLPEVLAEISNSVKILHTLTPVGVAMAGADTRDPYKD